jgi:endo-1,4-beta-xylanase
MGYFPSPKTFYKTLIVPVSGGTWSNATLTAVLKSHITTEITQYKEQRYAWDVMNEALNHGGTFQQTYSATLLGSTTYALPSIQPQLQTYM